MCCMQESSSSGSKALCGRQALSQKLFQVRIAFIFSDTFLACTVYCIHNFMLMNIQQMQWMFQRASCRRPQTWERSRHFYLQHPPKQLQTFPCRASNQKWTCQFSWPIKWCQPDPACTTPLFCLVSPTEHCCEASQPYATFPVLDGLSPEDSVGPAEVFPGSTTSHRGLHGYQEAHRAIKCFRKAQDPTHSWW